MPLDTILCLDVSGSMARAPINSLKQAAKEFVKGVQQTAECHGLRENIGIVIFGSTTRIVQSLTNNYARLQMVIDFLNAGGTTPMFQGLMESMKEILAHGGILSLPGGKKMTPRIILMTDGKPNNKDEVLKAAFSFGPLGWQKVGLPHSIPIACVGCGPEVDKELLALIAKITNGMFVVGNISQLSDFFRKQMLLIRFAAQFHHDMGNLRDLLMLRRFFTSLGESVDDDELNGLKTLLLAMMISGNDDDDDDSVDREIEGYPPLGARVRRGRDWKWGQQDGNGVGTVLKHKKSGCVEVEWDNGNKNTYRHGAERAIDLKIVDEPRNTHAFEGIKVGVRVVRGPDWEWNDQDGGSGNIGAVYKITNGQRFNVHVRWPNGRKGNYRYNSNVKDVKICSDNNDDSDSDDEDKTLKMLLALKLLSTLQ